MVGQLILALAILIVLHEGGHYITARWFGIKVEKFYLFFDAWGKKLFSFKKGDTEYGVGWLPLGGYVKIAGMIDESMDKEQMNEEPKEWEFRTKPAWQRLIVMLGGVVVNLILGIVIFWFMTAYYGDSEMPIEKANELGINALSFGEEVGFKDNDKLVSLNGNKLINFGDIRNVSEILEDEVIYGIERDGVQMDLKMPSDFISQLGDKRKEFLSYKYKFKVGTLSTDVLNAKEAGLVTGDKIIEINGEEILTYEDFSESLKPDLDLDLVVLRGTDSLNLKGKTDANGKLGFNVDISETDEFLVKKTYGFWESLPIGYSRGVQTISDQIKGFKAMIDGKINARKSLMGPIQLATVFGSEWNWHRFWQLTGLFSLVLAFMNLLPIPGLDGGHAVFCTVEMLTGKTLSDKWMMYVQTAGMVILLSLMVFIFGNDILRLLGI